MTLPIQRATTAELEAAKRNMLRYGEKTAPNAPTPPPMISKPTPVRDARKNVQDERSQLADARAKLMLAKQERDRTMADKVAKEVRDRTMADKAAKEAANKPPPVLPTPIPRPRPTTPMPDRPMPMPPQKPMSGGTAPPPTSSGGVMGGIAKAVQGAVNKMPTPVQNVIEPPVESSANSFSPMNASPAVEDGLGSAMKTMGMKRGGNVQTTRISTATRSKKSSNW